MPGCNKGVIKSAHGWINWKVLCVDKCLLWQRGRGAGPLRCKLMSQSAEMNDHRESNSNAHRFLFVIYVQCFAVRVSQQSYSSEQFIIEPTQQISKNIWYISKNSNLQLIRYKILRRVHCTAQKCEKWFCFDVKYAHIHISMLCGSAALFSSSRYK